MTEIKSKLEEIFRFILRENVNEKQHILLYCYRRKNLQHSSDPQFCCK
jgi:hypothetical protein